MNLRSVVLHATLLIFASLVPAQNTNWASQKNTQVGCRTFVQDFYDWYVPLALQNNSGPASDIAIQEKPGAFEPKLLRLLKHDSEAQSSFSELVGLDFDPILASQDPSERFAVETVTKNRSRCLVTVFGLSSGVKREELVAEVKFSGAHWRFANFHYRDGDQSWNLIGRLKLGLHAVARKPPDFEIRAFSSWIDVPATAAGFRTRTVSESCGASIVSFLKVSNGTAVSVRSVYFETADEARRYFEWTLERVAKVTRQGHNTDRNGKRVGSRAVISHDANAWEVMWTYGGTVRSFRSTDLAVALELEKEYRDPNFLGRALSGK